jgi:MYXO-CTERM domain-containing protein
MTSLKPIAPALALLMAATPAHALDYFGRNHLGYAWTPENMPVLYNVADDGTPDSECQDSMEPGECWDFAEQATLKWSSVPCVDIEAQINEVIPNEVNPAQNAIVEIYFDDPGGEINDPGTLAYAPSEVDGVQVEINGLKYNRIADSKIVFGEGRNFDSPEDIEAGCPQGGHSFLGTMTHEMGHSLGMAHTCEEGEVCIDPLRLQANMYWTGPECDTSGDDLNDLDVENFQALYGPYATFRCSREDAAGRVLGVVPFELNCAVESESLGDITDVSWAFGDGATADTLSITHTYTEPGNYNVQLQVAGFSDGCGEEGWDYNFRRVGYVTACAPVQGEFSYEQGDGLVFQMLNESDVSVYGCISEIEWNVFAGESASGEPIISGLRAWEPEFELPEPGMYTVVMNLGGPAGTTGASLTIDARSNGRDGGCTTASGGAASGLLGLFALFGLRRRR